METQNVQEEVQEWIDEQTIKFAELKQMKAEEYKCRECNGTGIDVDLVLPEYRDRIDDIEFVEDDGVFCFNCKGKGKVDFVTNVMKKEK